MNMNAKGCYYYLSNFTGLQPGQEMTGNEIILSRFKNNGWLFQSIGGPSAFDEERFGDVLMVLTCDGRIAFTLAVWFDEHD